MLFHIYKNKLPRKICGFTEPDAHTHTVHTSLSYIRIYHVFISIQPAERETHTDTDTDRQTVDRQRGGEEERQADRQTDKRKDGQRERQRQTD